MGCAHPIAPASASSRAPRWRAGADSTWATGWCAGTGRLTQRLSRSLVGLLQRAPASAAGSARRWRAGAGSTWATGWCAGRAAGHWRRGHAASSCSPGTPFCSRAGQRRRPAHSAPQHDRGICQQPHVAPQRGSAAELAGAAGLGRMSAIPVQECALHAGHPATAHPELWTCTSASSAGGCPVQGTDRAGAERHIQHGHEIKLTWFVMPTEPTGVDTTLQAVQVAAKAYAKISRNCPALHTEAGGDAWRLTWPHA